jgi:hypothetical protein
MLYGSRFVKSFPKTPQHFVLSAGCNTDPKARRVLVDRESRSPRRSAVADFASFYTALDAR